MFIVIVESKGATTINLMVTYVYGHGSVLETTYNHYLGTLLDIV